MRLLEESPRTGVGDVAKARVWMNLLTVLPVTIWQQKPPTSYLPGTKNCFGPSYQPITGQVASRSTALVQLYLGALCFVHNTD